MISLAGDLPVTDGLEPNRSTVFETPSTNSTFYHRTDEGSQYGHGGRIEFMEKCVYCLVFLLLIGSVCFELISFKSVAISFPQSSFVIIIVYCICHALIMFIFVIYQRYIHQSPQYVKLFGTHNNSNNKNKNNNNKNENSYTSLRNDTNKRKVLEMAHDNGIYRIYRSSKDIHLSIYIPCGILQCLSLSVLFVCVSVGVSGSLMIILMQLSIPFSIVFSCFINKTNISKTHMTAIGLVILGGLFGILANILGEFGNIYYSESNSKYINAWWYGIIVFISMIFNGLQILYMNINNLTVFKEIGLTNLSNLNEKELDNILNQINQLTNTNATNNNNDASLEMNMRPELDLSYDGKIPQSLLNGWISLYQCIFTILISPILFYLQMPEENSNFYKNNFEQFKNTIIQAFDDINDSTVQSKYTFWLFVSICVPLLMNIVGNKISLLFVKIGTLIGVTCAFISFQIGFPQWLLGVTYVESSDECLLLAILCAIVGSIMLLIDFNPMRNTYFFDSHTKSATNATAQNENMYKNNKAYFEHQYGGLLDQEYSHVMSTTSLQSQMMMNTQYHSSIMDENDIEIDILTRTKTRTKTKTKTKTKTRVFGGKYNDNNNMTIPSDTDDMDFHSPILTPSMPSKQAWTGQSPLQMSLSGNYEDLRNSMDAGMANLKGKMDKRAFVEYLLEQHQRELMKEELVKERQRLKEESLNKGYSFSREFYSNNHKNNIKNDKNKNNKKHKNGTTLHNFKDNNNNNAACTGGSATTTAAPGAIRGGRAAGYAPNGNGAPNSSTSASGSRSNFMFSQQYQSNLKKYYAYIQQQQSQSQIQSQSRTLFDSYDHLNNGYYNTNNHNNNNNGFPDIDNNCSHSQSNLMNDGRNINTNTRFTFGARINRFDDASKSTPYLNNNNNNGRRGRSNSVHSMHSNYGIEDNRTPWHDPLSPLPDTPVSKNDVVNNNNNNNINQSNFDCESFAISNPLLAGVIYDDNKDKRKNKNNNKEKSKSKQSKRSKHTKLKRKNSDPLAYR